MRALVVVLVATLAGCSALGGNGSATKLPTPQPGETISLATPVGTATVSQKAAYVPAAPPTCTVNVFVGADGGVTVVDAGAGDAGHD